MHVRVSYPLQRRLIWPITIGGFSALIGAALVVQPTLAWFLLMGIAGIGLLQLPPYQLASLAVVVVIFSRLFVAWRIAPGLINFFHFPLALAAAFSAMFHHRKNAGRTENQLFIGLMALALLTFFSWLANGGEFLRPILSWLLFAEPFLVVYAIVKTTPPNKVYILSKLAIGLALIQIPFAYWQAMTLGLGDVVQGTLIGQGAGAHIVGAIALLGVTALLARTLSPNRGVKTSWHWALVALLFPIPVLADAKQVIMAWVPAIGLVLWRYGKLRFRSVFVTAVIAGLIVSAGILYQPLRMAVDMDLILRGLGGKVLSYQIVTETMWENPGTLIIGLGPGNSVSRTALAAQEGYIRSLPKGWVNLELSHTTAAILSSTAGYYLFASSSVWSGVSSWLGLFGDLGILGLGIYAWLLWSIWQGFGRRKSSWSYVGQAAAIMGLILGAVFSWLETPEFTLPWALYMAIGLITDETSRYPQPLHPARR